MIVSGSSEGSFHLRDGKNKAAIGEPLRRHDHRVSCVCISGDGGMILSGSKNGSLRLWDTRSGAAMGEPFDG